MLRSTIALIVCCFAVVLVVGMTIGSVLSFAALRGESLGQVLSEDISLNCFASETYYLFVGWMLVDSIGLLMLLIVRSWLILHESPTRPGQVFNICLLIVGALAIVCLNTLCPIAVLSIDLHFVFSLCGIGLLYVYGIMHLIMFGCSMRRSKQKLFPKWVNIVFLLFWMYGGGFVFFLFMLIFDFKSMCDNRSCVCNFVGVV